MHNFLFSVVAILIILVLSYFKCGITVKDSFKKEDIYNLLTINTIFSGFLYTMLGNLVEFNSRKEIKKRILQDTWINIIVLYILV